MTTLVIRPSGRPAPQGSKTRGAAGQMREASDYLPAWRAAIKRDAFRAMLDRGISPGDRPVFPAGTAVHVRITFFMAPEQGALTGKPDIDKLIRAVFDPLTTSGVWADDSQVVSVRAEQALMDSAGPGADITVSDAVILNSPNDRESALMGRYRLTLTDLDAPDDDPADGVLVEVIGTSSILLSILPAVGDALGVPSGPRPANPAAPADAAQETPRRTRRTKAEMAAARAPQPTAVAVNTVESEASPPAVAPQNNGTVVGAAAAPYNPFVTQ